MLADPGITEIMVNLADEVFVVISPCNSVHTLGMRYAIDLVFLHKHGLAKKLVRRLKPMRAAVCLGAHSALELRAGAIDELSIRPGDQISLGA